MEISLRKANSLQVSIIDRLEDGFDSVDNTIDAMLVPDWKSEALNLLSLHRQQLSDKLGLINCRYIIRELVARANAEHGLSQLMTKISGIEQEMRLIQYALRNVTVQESESIIQRKIDLKQKELDKSERAFVSRTSVDVSVFDIEYKRYLEKLHRERKRTTQTLNDQLLELNITTKIILPSAVVDLLRRHHLVD